MGWASAGVAQCLKAGAFCGVVVLFGRVGARCDAQAFEVGMGFGEECEFEGIVSFVVGGQLPLEVEPVEGRPA